MTPEELAARYPVGSRWKDPTDGAEMLILGHEAAFEVRAFDTRERLPLLLSEHYAANWTRIDAPEPVAEPTPATDDGLRERAALAALTGLLAGHDVGNDDWISSKIAAANAWEYADAFIAAKGSAHD